MKAKTWQQLALHRVNESRKQYEGYEESVRYWYRHGDGHLHGHRYPACIHGTSYWTDYDNICGPCENGEGSFDYLRELDYARYEAKELWREFNRRLGIVIQLNVARVTFVDFDAAQKWLEEPIMIGNK